MFLPAKALKIMNEDDSEKRIYLGDCGCVRIESKHFRLTIQPEDFVEILRKIIKEKNKIPNRLTISNNVSDSGGFVTIQNNRRRKYE